MVGVYLSVWVRAALLPAVRGVQVTSVGTGIMGYLGNKGERQQPPLDRPARHMSLHPYDSLGIEAPSECVAWSQSWQTGSGPDAMMLLRKCPGVAGNAS